MSDPEMHLGGRWRASLDRWTAPLFFVCLVAVWELCCRLFAIPSFLLPSPTEIVMAMTTLPLGLWVTHICATLKVALAGYLMAIAVSIPLAVILAGSRFLSKTLFPLLIVIQSTPVVAIAPILVVTMGANDGARILITFLISFFPIVVSTITGLLAAPEELIELSRSLRAGRRREVVQIRLPYATPYIFAALKVSTTLSIIGAVVAELVAANQGLGYLIAYSMSMFRVPTAFAGLLVLIILSLSFFQLIVLIQKLRFPWSLDKV